MNISAAVINDNLLLVINAPTEEKFAEYLTKLSKTKKRDMYQYIESNAVNRHIFESIAPILSGFDAFDKKQWILKGSMIIDKTEIYPMYPVGKRQHNMKRHNALKFIPHEC